MSDRYENEQACGIEPEREGDGPTLEQWRERCRQLWRENAALQDSLNKAYDRMQELDRYRERYERLREALIDALGPQADTIISLAVK